MEQTSELSSVKKILSKQRNKKGLEYSSEAEDTEKTIFPRRDKSGTLTHFGEQREKMFRLLVNGKSFEFHRHTSN